MKVIDEKFESDLKGKITCEDPDDFADKENRIEYTGNIRRIKTIFGKIKLQAEFYMLTIRWSMWSKDTYNTIKIGPYWKTINEKH